MHVRKTYQKEGYGCVRTVVLWVKFVFPSIPVGSDLGVVLSCFDYKENKTTNQRNLGRNKPWETLFGGQEHHSKKVIFLQILLKFVNTTFVQWLLSKLGIKNSMGSLWPRRGHFTLLLTAVPQGPPKSVFKRPHASVLWMFTETERIWRSRQCM